MEDTSKVIDSLTEILAMIASGEMTEEIAEKLLSLF